MFKVGVKAYNRDLKDNIKENKKRPLIKSLFLIVKSYKIK